VSTPLVTRPPGPGVSGPRHRHSPRVRRLALEHGLALETIGGTRPGGRVSPADVLRAAAAARQSATELAPRLAPVPEPAPGTAVQLTTVVEVDVTRVVALADSVRDNLERQTGIRLSLTAFCAKAALEALRSHPRLGSCRDLGLVVDSAAGRVTYKISNAGDLNLLALAREIAEASVRARTVASHPGNADGTLTLTDSGSLGALLETPALNPPQAGAIALGTVVARPTAVRHGDGSYAIAIRSIAYLALSYDRRIIDGVYATRYLAGVKARLEVGDFVADLRC